MIAPRRRWSFSLLALLMVIAAFTCIFRFAIDPNPSMARIFVASWGIAIVIAPGVIFAVGRWSARR